MSPTFGRDAIYFLARSHWLMSGMPSNLCLWTFFKNLWIWSLIFPVVSLSFTFSEHWRSWQQNFWPVLVTIPFLEYSSEHTLAHVWIPWFISAVVLSLEILPLKCLKNSLSLSLSFFVSNLCFLWCASCQLPLFLHYGLLYLGQFLHSLSLKFSFQFRINLF